MRVRPPQVARFGLTTFVLGCTMAGAWAGQARTTLAQTPKRAALMAAGDITLPDLPDAPVTIRTDDLRPGEEAGAAVSRLVAAPGTILDTYAPLKDRAVPAERNVDPARPSATGAVQVLVRASPPRPAARAATRAVVDSVAPEPSIAAAPRPNGPGVVSSTLGKAASADPPGPATAANRHRASELALAEPQTVVASMPTGSIGAAAIAPSLPTPAATPSVAPQATVAPAPEAATPAPGPGPDADAAILDAASLRRALDAFVGPEVAPVKGVDADARRRDRQAIAAVYAERGFAPLWVEDGRFTAQARSALARVDHAAEDGLDLRGTSVAVPHGGTPADLAEAEISLSRAIVAYGQQASGGRIDPARISDLIAAKPDVADAARVLGAAAGAPDAGDALRAFNPPQPGYAALRAKLAELRRNSDVAGRGGTIPYGPTLKLGMRDSRVPLIRARFGIDPPSDAAGENGLVYDTRVATAIADFQRSRGMPASGLLTIRTTAALSGGDPRRLENEIIANMERWRWLPRDLGDDHIEVNIPDFSLDVKHGDAVVHHARVVVGKPDHQTPVFSQSMQFIIVNPYWNVPLSIVKKEMLPKLAAEPNYFADHGYEVVERDGVTYVRQPPGDSNALGHIKFMFPNKFSVYLHDTNARALFGNDRRAMSHGCVRVDQPFKLAATVLGPDRGWTEARIKKMVGGNERTIMLPRPMPLHIVYFTAYVDGNGALQMRDDVYGYSAKVKAALGLDG